MIVLGDGDVRAVLEALDQGAHDVLSDPPGGAELIARVRSAARASSLREQLLARESRLEQLVFNDELTGLWNRRSLQRRLAAELHAARRHGNGLSITMVDVDHFKAVNDEHGHPVGDQVLAVVAQRLTEAVRVEDVVGRWGGEEFLAILPRIDAVGAHAVAERIRRRVADDAVGASGIAITVPVGCATLDDETSAHDLLARADDALYAAKRGGGGRGRRAVRAGRRGQRRRRRPPRPEPLCVLAHARPSDVAQRAMTRELSRRFDPVAVIDDLGRLIGVVRIERLVEALAAAAT